MRVVITKVEQKDNDVIVNVNTDIGEIKGIWTSKAIPNKGDVCYIEFNFVDYSQYITRLYNSSPAKVTTWEDEICFIGYCEDMDEDIYYIRFGSDWLEMIEIPENDVKIEKGDCVTFSVKCEDIQIYPYSL